MLSIFKFEVIITFTQGQPKLLIKQYLWAWLIRVAPPVPDGAVVDVAGVLADAHVLVAVDVAAGGEAGVWPLEVGLDQAGRGAGRAVDPHHKGIEPRLVLGEKAVLISGWLWKKVIHKNYLWR